MTGRQRPLELLAPARNAEFGIEAIRHGADAVYIGGPAFGARSAADNSLADIARLAEYAHRYSAQVFLALNTILRDDELEAARSLAWQAHDAGVDALIIQDMGLLELDLPPLALHASTQADNRSLAKVRFLAGAGFSRVVLARELSLEQISEISAGCDVELEFFVHGALCVSYSGQCYVSHAQTGRSANRGECSQMCRLPFTVTDQQGQTIVRDKHVLSPRDNNQSANLHALAAAGVQSFKIEGRLKDLAYLKNITAHYRRLLDGIIEENPQYRAASAGHCTFFFEPQPEKSFNRGFTDYFARQRHEDLLALDSPKFVGEPVGKVVASGRDWFEIDTSEELHNGDGLSWYEDEQLVGAHLNHMEGKHIHPSSCERMPQAGTLVYRNRDRAFERSLEGKSAERRIGVRMVLAGTVNGVELHLCDEQGICSTTSANLAYEPAKDVVRMESTWREQLGKLGNTPFHATGIELRLAPVGFVPTRFINALRRDAVVTHEQVRCAAYRRPLRAEPVQPPVSYPESALSYLGNVFNQKAREFYKRHGVSLIEDAYEANRERGDVSLMITKHCVRYSFNLCPKQVKGIRPDPMTLRSAGEDLRLEFDCKRCEMHVIGRLRPQKVVFGSL